MTLDFQDITFDAAKGVTSEYELPVATTTTLGGVKIDGTTIEINDGVISAPVDSALSSTSEKPVQNKVVYAGLSGFIPAGTIITVKSDGTGDYEKLSDAISYLAGKWSDGTVTISVYGTITEDAAIIVYGGEFSIPYLCITGQGSDPKVQFTVMGSGLIFKDIAKASVVSLTLENTNGTVSTDYKLINCFEFSDVYVDSCTMSGGGLSSDSCNTMISGNITINDTKIAINSVLGGSVVMSSANNLITSNAVTLLRVSQGGRIIIHSTTTKSFTGSTVSNVARGTYSIDGFVAYPSNW